MQMNPILSGFTVMRRQQSDCIDLSINVLPIISAPEVTLTSFYIVASSNNWEYLQLKN